MLLSNHYQRYRACVKMYVLWGDKKSLLSWKPHQLCILSFEQIAIQCNVESRSTLIFTLEKSVPY